jgi:predicted RNA binding protein YcfA (HicA-like mRNA interferase family)
MKLPRGVSGDRLIHILFGLGYSVIRQKGSQVRLRYEGPPAHTLTVPRHNSLKTGTLHGILLEVAQARSITLESRAKLL